MRVGLLFVSMDCSVAVQICREEGFLLFFCLDTFMYCYRLCTHCSILDGSNYTGHGVSRGCYGVVEHEIAYVWDDRVDDVLYSQFGPWICDPVKVREFGDKRFLV